MIKLQTLPLNKQKDADVVQILDHYESSLAITNAIGCLMSHATIFQLYM